MGLTVILLLVAFILFVLDAVGVAARFNLTAAGLACATLAALVGAL
jgi:hypothetical protein